MNDLDPLEFVQDDEPLVPDPAPTARPWRILIVDDAEDVHESMRFGLRGMQIEGRPLQLLHAHSGASALALLAREPEVAVILLDVVMETEQAGLDIVERIRGELGLAHVRIVLHTGQPGHAPEIDTIRRYDINDYKTKGELTRARLYVALTAAVRSYGQLRRIEAGRRGLEQIVEAGGRLMAQDGLAGFAQEALAELARLLEQPEDGLVCVREARGPVLHATVLAAGGPQAAMLGRRIAELPDAQAGADLACALTERRHVLAPRRLALFLPGRDGRDLGLLLQTDGPLEGVHERLVNVLCANLALTASNLDLRARLREQAFVDRSLGLPNRLALVEHIDQAGASGAAQDHVLALLDVDHFSATNDMFGHAYGDQLLAAIAQRLVQGLPASSLLARVTGDTFGIWGRADVVEPGHLSVLLAQPFEIDGVARPVSVSLGLARWEAGAPSGQDLAKNAAIALKQAKAAGQSGAQYYSPEVGEATRERTRLLHDLRQAVDRGQLQLAYQPQLSLASGRAVGAEALLRWQTEDGRFISPAQFIPVAEQSGLIVPIGRWVLRAALQALARLRGPGSTLRMAVNVSPLQFAQPDFLDDVDEALGQAQLPPEALELEITESVAVMGLERVAAVLRAIKARGIAVAIDDFGTGFSSLSYLDRLPADRLKIDRAFVSALDAGGAGARIAEMIVPLGRRLGMQVLAEGVETQAQAAQLRQLGCDEVQGYLYARPMPLDALGAWLAEHGGG
ncbi:EAL domain-containing protein [Pseudorhodoferax sp.]|uniref:EAL domain-containing protein n=1 Tax=Pseudorhodoferax sp. TaxID=1993553 RepID=UPI002DD628D1|nr:EAL domain-containing protein [Pseudorhodoferax sp.]